MAEPEYSVAISDEMRALWHASRRGGLRQQSSDGTPRQARKKRPAAPLPEPKPEPARRTTLAPLERVVLRRDGQRPLVFDGAGLLALAHADEDSAAEFRLGLYLAADGRAVVSLALRPTGSEPAQEIHRAEAVDTAGDLGFLLDRFDPGLALPCPLGMPEDRAAAVTDRTRRLAEGYARFRDVLRGVGAINPLWREM